MLKSMCNDVRTKRYMVCSTMWDKVDEDEGNTRFDELCETGIGKLISTFGGMSILSNLGPNGKAEAEEVVNAAIERAGPARQWVERTLSTSISKSGTGLEVTGDSLERADEASTSGVHEVSNAFNAPEDPGKLARERRLLESEAPIVVCVTSCMLPCDKKVDRHAASWGRLDLENLRYAAACPG